MNKFKNFIIGIAIILGSIAYFAIVFLTTSASSSTATLTPSKSKTINFILNRSIIEY